MASSVPSVRSLVSVDLPSHGDSDAVPVRTDQGESYIAWSDMTERVREAAQAWRAEQRGGAQQLAVFAHSMGGAISLQASMQQPGIFDSLFLAEPIILPPPFTHRFSDMPSHSPAPSALKRRSTFRVPMRPGAITRSARLFRVEPRSAALADRALVSTHRRRHRYHDETVTETAGRYVLRRSGHAPV
jgi:pimeloyl-ACP methyl ester carboxylesterase